MDDMDTSEPVQVFMMIEFDSTRRYRIKFSEISALTLCPSQQANAVNLLSRHYFAPLLLQSCSLCTILTIFEIYDGPGSDVEYLQNNSSSEASQSMIEKHKQLMQKPPYLRIAFPSVCLQLYHLPSQQSSSGFPATDFFQRYSDLSHLCDTLVTSINDWTKSGGRKRPQRRSTSSLQMGSLQDADSMDVDEDVRSNSAKSQSAKFASLSSEELRAAALNGNKSWAQLLRQLSEVARMDTSKSANTYSTSLSELADRMSQFYVSSVEADALQQQSEANIAQSRKELDEALDRMFPDANLLAEATQHPEPLNPSQASAVVAPLLARWHGEEQAALVAQLTNVSYLSVDKSDVNN